MDTASKQLEQLDQEIADITAEAKEAKEAWLSASDPQQKADLKEIWQQLQVRVQAIDFRRSKLEDKLGTPGVHTPLLAHSCSVSAVEQVAQRVHHSASCPLYYEVHSIRCADCAQPALSALAATEQSRVSPDQGWAHTARLLLTGKNRLPVDCYIFQRFSISCSPEQRSTVDLQLY